MCWMILKGDNTFFGQILNVIELQTKNIEEAVAYCHIVKLARRLGAIKIMCDMF